METIIAGYDNSILLDLNPTEQYFLFEFISEIGCDPVCLIFENLSDCENYQEFNINYPFAYGGVWKVNIYEQSSSTNTDPDNATLLSTMYFKIESGITQQFSFTVEDEFDALFSSTGNFSVLWGDGSYDNYEAGDDVSVAHTYDSPGTYTVRVGDTVETITKIEVLSNSNMIMNIADLPSSLLEFVVNTTNEIYGDISDLPPSIEIVEILGSNVITGDIANLPNTLTGFSVQGSNTIYGDIANIPAIETFQVYGNTTISGNVANIPSGVVQLYIDGNSTLSGNINAMPDSLLVIYIDGVNTIDGNLKTAPSDMTYCQIAGQSKISQYNNRTWANPMMGLILVPATDGLSAGEVDQLLIDLSASTFINDKIITITGTNAARTAASNAAYNSLIAQGVTITLN